MCSHKGHYHYFIFLMLSFLYVFSLPFYYSSEPEGLFDLSGVEGFIVSPQIILVGLLAFVLTCDLLLFNKVVIRRIKYPYIYLLYVICAVIFLITNLRYPADGALNFCIYYVLLILFFLYIGNDVNYVQQFNRALVLAAVLHGVLGVYMLIFGGIELFSFKAAQYPEYFRLHGLMANPNYAANVAAVALFLVLINYDGAGKSKILTLGLLAFLVLTFSRGAFFAFVISLMVASLFFISYKVFGYLLALGLFLVFIAFLLGVDNFLYVAKMQDSENIGTLSGRLDIWASAYSYMIDQDLLIFLYGNGYGSFSDIIGHGAHSFYIKSLFENGVIFVFIFLIMCCMLLFRICTAVGSNRKKAILVFAMFFFFIVRSFTSPSLFNGSYPAVIFMFLITSYVRDGINSFDFRREAP